MKISLKNLLPYWIIFYFLGSNLIPGNIRTLQFASLYLLAAIVFYLNWKKLLFLFIKDFWIPVLIGLAGASYFWSVNPDITFANFRTLIVQYILAGYIVITYQPKHVVEYLSKLLSAVVLVSFAYVFLFPDVGINRGVNWRGIFPHQSYLSAVSALASISIFNAFLSFKTEIQSKVRITSILALLSICLIVIYFSQSRSPLIGLIASFAILPFFYLRQIKGAKTRAQVFMFLLYLLIIGVPLALLMKDFIIVDVLGKTTDLTGRADLWEHLSTKVSERPFLGYGQGAFWHNEQLSQEATSRLGRRIPKNYNSHSSYFECLIGTGYIGLTLLFLSIFNVVRRNILLIFRHNQIEPRWGLQVIVLLLIASYSDTFIGFLNARGIGWLVFCIISLISTRQIQEFATKSFQESGNPYIYKSRSKHSAG